MNWISDRMPPESNSYLVSIRIERNDSTEIFKYIAHYESSTNSWYKYDPFDLKYTPTEKVEGEVTAWANNVVAHL